MKRFLTLISLLALVNSPVWAQPSLEAETGSQIRRPAPARIGDRILTDEERSRDMMNKFARCIVDRAPKEVALAIALPAGDDGAAFARASQDDCLANATMRFSPAVIRGAVFGELVRRVERGDRSVTTRFPVPTLDLAAPVPPESNARGRTNWFLMWISDCIAKSHAAEMRTIVTSTAASGTQEQAYAAVVPAIGPCVPEGQTLRFSKAVIEGGFSEYLYRTLPPVASVAAVSEEKH